MYVGERWLLTPGTTKNDLERRAELIYGSTAFDISSSKVDNFCDVSSSSVARRTFPRVMRLFVRRKAGRIVNFLSVTSFYVAAGAPGFPQIDHASDLAFRMEIILITNTTRFLRHEDVMLLCFTLINDVRYNTSSNRDNNSLYPRA